LKSAVKAELNMKIEMTKGLRFVPAKLVSTLQKKFIPSQDAHKKYLKMTMLGFKKTIVFIIIISLT